MTGEVQRQKSKDTFLQTDEGIRTIKALISYAKKHLRYVSVVCVITVYGLLGFFLAPYLLEKNLVETMQQEFDAELRVEKIEINPFVLSLRINGLELDNPEGEPTVRPGGGESRLEIRLRTRDLILDLADRYAGQHLIVVTHLGVIRALVPGAELNNTGQIEVVAEEIAARPIDRHRRPEMGTL